MQSCFFIACLLQALAHSAGAPTKLTDASGNSLVVASWYGKGSHNADGSRFNRNNPHTCAHKTLPFGTELLLTNPDNGRSLTCIVKDRGPFIRGRSIDVTKAGAERLGFTGRGTAHLQVAIQSRP